MLGEVVQNWLQLDLTLGFKTIYTSYLIIACMLKVIGDFKMSEQRLNSEMLITTFGNFRA